MPRDTIYIVIVDGITQIFADFFECLTIFFKNRSMSRINSCGSMIRCVKSSREVECNGTIGVASDYTRNARYAKKAHLSYTTTL